MPARNTFGAALDGWSVTPSNVPQPIGNFSGVSCTGAGTIVVYFADGSGPFTFSLNANQQYTFPYPIQILTPASTATGIVAFGWGSTGSGIILPTQLVGLNLWLRGDLGLTFNGPSGNGNPLSAWADQSGSGNNYTQVATLNQPTWSASGGPIGTPGISLSGSNWFSAAAAILNNAAVTLFAVLKFNSASTNQIPMGFGSSAGGHTGGWTLQQVSSNRGVHASGVADMLDGAATTNAEKWLIQSSAGNAWSMSVNGSPVSLTNSATVPGAQSAVSAIGALSSDGFAGMTGLLMEVIGLNRFANADEIGAVHNYLFARYGI